LKEQLIEEWRHFDHGITELSISGGSDCEGVFMRTEDTFNIYLGTLNVGTVITFCVDSSCTV